MLSFCGKNFGVGIAVEALLQSKKSTGFLTESMAAHVAERFVFLLNEGVDSRIEMVKRMKKCMRFCLQWRMATIQNVRLRILMTCCITPRN